MAPSSRSCKKRKNVEEEENDVDDVPEKAVKTSEQDTAPASRARRASNTAKEVDTTADLGKWTEFDSLLIFNHKDTKPSDKIAAFDFDSTLVCTKSGAAFAKNATDWQPFHPSLVATRLKKLHEDGFKLVIFSNQGGIGKGHATAESIKKRMELFIASVGVPFQVFAAQEDDHYRKPSSEMWRLMLSKYNGDVHTPDLSKCFYVGDAAGRPKEWKKAAKKDHSCGDRKFGLNCHVAFHTPEEYFLGEPVFKDFELDFDPSSVREEADKRKPYTKEDLGIGKTGQEMVVFVGFPASGKSSFAKRHFVPAGYEHVNRDTLKTPAKCLKFAEQALKDGKCVVIDNTSPSVKARKEYLDIARAHSVPARAFYFKADQQLAQHMNRFRERITKGESPHVPRVGYNLYKKNFEAPSKREGFTEVREIEFVPDFGGKKDLEERFYEYNEI